MAENNNIDSYLLKKAILEEYSQNNVNIQYSSLWAAENGKSKLTTIIRIVVGIVTFLSIAYQALAETEVINSKISLTIISVLIIALPALISSFVPDWIISVLSLKNNTAKELLKLNEKLQKYEIKLESLYRKACSPNCNVSELNHDFDELRNDFIEATNQHDKLTGVLDEKLVELATDKTIEIMNVKELVIYEQQDTKSATTAATATC